MTIEVRCSHLSLCHTPLIHVNHYMISLYCEEAMYVRMPSVRDKTHTTKTSHGTHIELNS
jgi:hypothetical protein